MLDEARSKAYDDMMDELSCDPEMVKPINYVERYNALRSVGDSRVVVQKLELTLDQADALLKRVSASNPASARLLPTQRAPWSFLAPRWGSPMTM